MIPKIIHFCWMSGDPYPPQIQRCINSWKKVLPEYEIWLWDVKRFDINSSIWVKQAYDAKKYAFCADYLRLYVLYNYGGIYLDSDVEVIKSFDDLLHLPYFIGYESKKYLEAAVIGSEKQNLFLFKILQYYTNRSFRLSSGEQDLLILPKIMMQEIQGHWMINSITSIDDFDYSSNVINVFPYDWFSPIDSTGKHYVLKQTLNTYCIHHFVSAWVDWKVKLLVRVFGLNSPTRLALQKYAKKFVLRIKRLFSYVYGGQ